MSMRYQAGIVLPGYNALKVANAPTIGTATAGNTQVSVAFTAPSCVGGGAISSYTAYCTTTGTKTATGASSPLIVTGLTNGTAYTFKVVATNAYGPSYPSGASASATPAIPSGSQTYTTAGSYSWVAPTDVTQIKVSLVGGGGGGHMGNTGCCYDPGGGAGGGSGGYGYYCVTPGNSYAVVVGNRGTVGDNATPGGTGGSSSFASTVFVASGGVGGTTSSGGAGGTVSGSGTWTVSASGGSGGSPSSGYGSCGAAGGGGAGNQNFYTGGAGGSATFTYGGGGGGGYPDAYGGSSGGGSGTTSGGRAKPTGARGCGGSYGGGGGGGNWYPGGGTSAGNGAVGIVKIEWGGGI